MRKSIFCTMLASLFAGMVYAQDYTVTVSGVTFDPQDLVINVGETVEWDNIGGFHNVNGSTATFPDNPEGFLSGSPAGAPWMFSYTFTVPGVYSYQCDIHAGAGMSGTVTVVGGPVTENLILTGVYDGTLTGGQPKGVELYALDDIADLSTFGIGSANNGGGSDGQEFTFPAMAVAAGSFIYVTADSLAFIDFFGFSPDFEDLDGGVNVNGDDAIELYENGTIIDIFGDPNMSGTGQAWEYTDGWAYRVDATGPDGDTFVISNWFFGGVDALEGGTNNATAITPFPIGTYQITPPSTITANDDIFTTDVNTTLSFNVLANDIVPGGSALTVSLGTVLNGVLTSIGSGAFEFAPDTDFCGTVMFDYEACLPDLSSCDTATVTINIECPVDFPAYDIATVTTINASGNPDSVGVACQLQGIVHGIDLQADNPVQFFLIDGTGGISIFSTNNFGYTVQEGDEIIVQGTISEFSCLTQITPDNIELVSSNNDLIDPMVISAPMTEAQESELIRINNLSLVTPSQWDNSNPAGFNVTVTDGSNEYQLRIDEQTDLYNQSAPTGTFDAIGLGSQFDNDGTCNSGYQFLPRYMQDIIPVVSTKDLDLSQEIRLSPNPVSTELNIRSSINYEAVIVQNVLGEVLFSTEQPIERLSTADWTPGMYFISFKTKAGSWTTSIVK